MRLGGPVFDGGDGPQSWARAVRAEGYGAAYCPVQPGVPHDVIRQYSETAKAADIVIAEVGAWSNPLSPDSAAAAQALEKCKASLELADAIGARCCVNIAGSRGVKWDGPSRHDLTDETFERIVDVVREIIDAVHPVRSFYTLETMPWMYPDSPDAYLRLIRAVDRRAFAVHLDVVNLVNSPRRYFNNAALIRDCFDRLGPWIKSCHAKDIVLRDNLTVHLDETRPGNGALDYGVFLEELSRLDADTPLMLEHLNDISEYREASSFLRRVASEKGLSFCPES